MKHKSRDVTATTNPADMPPTHNINFPGAVREQSPTPARQPSITPAKPVSGFDKTGIRSRETLSPTFTLPDSVSARQVQQDSFKYGGGRSAGSRSPADTSNRRIKP